MFPLCIAIILFWYMSVKRSLESVSLDGVHLSAGEERMFPGHETIAYSYMLGLLSREFSVGKAAGRNGCPSQQSPCNPRQDDLNPESGITLLKSVQVVLLLNVVPGCDDHGSIASGQDEK
eukprot:m.93625 g.93625  ORF g.93625 m.93625 type:complete len:120 (-) comp14708_c0_seq1:1483-1842(-)